MPYHLACTLGTLTRRASIHLKIVLTVFVFTGLLLSCTSSTSEAKQSSSLPDFIYYETAQIDAIKHELAQGNELYGNALATVTKKANKAVKQQPDSVMNKPKAGPSGNKHDYLSISPYFWPDPDTATGLPWLYKDGQVNPQTRGKHTDQQRASRFLKNLDTLFMAYVYTQQDVYADAMQAQINTWLVDPSTKMNPHLKYAQGMPGRNEGSSFGIIEWTGVSNIVTAMQLLKHENKLSDDFVAAVDTWLADYLHWLQTSDLGLHEKTRKNNHGPWYDYQVAGILLYLNRDSEAKSYLEGIKDRINTHFLADGSQPHELKRTKSINYSSMNLQALLNLAHMARKVEVDLWAYEGLQGQSLQQGVAYFYPYLRDQKTWQYQQIWRTVAQAYELKTYPMLYIAQAHFGSNTVPSDIYNKIVPTLAPEYLLKFYAK